MTPHRSALLAALMAAGLGFGVTSAQAGIALLDLDFNDPEIGAAGTIVQAAAGVHGLPTLPTNTTVAQPGPAGSSWVNIRRNDNAIDGTAAGNNTNTFDNFFSAGNFLVIGDSTGNLGGDLVGTSSISIPFFIPGYSESLTISYDWVFDHNFTNTSTNINSDDFDVDLVFGTVETEVDSVGAPDQNGITRGTFTQTFSGPALAGLLGTTQFLRFQLAEAAGTGSSAVGIDNIRASVVPEPGSLALVGIALLGVGVLSRRGVARA